MRSPTKRLLLMVLALVFVPQLVLAAGPVKLRYRFQKGEMLSYRMVMDQDMEITTDVAPGAAQKVSTQMEVEMYQKVTGLGKGAATLEVGFNKFDARMSMGGNQMPFPGMESVKKMRMSMRMTELGETSEMKLINPDEIDQMARSMAESMNKSMSQINLVFPQKPLSPGDTWKFEQELPANIPGAPNMKMKVSSQYRLLGMEEARGMHCAKVKADVKLSLSGASEQGGIPLKADMQGAGSGENLFAIAQGRMVSSQAAFTIAGNVKAEASGQQIDSKLKMGLKMKMDLK